MYDLHGPIYDPDDEGRDAAKDARAEERERAEEEIRAAKRANYLKKMRESK